MSRNDSDYVRNEPEFMSDEKCSPSISIPKDTIKISTDLNKSCLNSYNQTFYINGNSNDKTFYAEITSYCQMIPRNHIDFNAMMVFYDNTYKNDYLGDDEKAYILNALHFNFENEKYVLDYKCTPDSKDKYINISPRASSSVFVRVEHINNKIGITDIYIVCTIGGGRTVTLIPAVNETKTVDKKPKFLFLLIDLDYKTNRD